MGQKTIPLFVKLVTRNLKAYPGGQSLIEILIALTLVTIVATMVIIFVQTGLRSTKSSGEKTRSTELAQEAMEITRSIAQDDWTKVCENTFSQCTTTAGTDYYPTQSGGAWILTTGRETVTLDGEPYTRWIAFSRVNRDANGEIVLVGGTEDPSTRKVVVTVETLGSPDAVLTDYLTRWGGSRPDTSRGTNVFYQTDWSGGPTGTPPIILSSPSGTTSLGTLFSDPTPGLDWFDTGTVWIDAQ